MIDSWLKEACKALKNILGMKINKVKKIYVLLSKSRLMSYHQLVKQYNIITQITYVCTKLKHYNKTLIKLQHVVKCTTIFIVIELLGFNY
jgi:hypothetical protein